MPWTLGGARSTQCQDTVTRWSIPWGVGSTEISEHIVPSAHYEIIIACNVVKTLDQWSTDWRVAGLTGRWVVRFRDRRVARFDRLTGGRVDGARCLFFGRTPSTIFILYVCEQWRIWWDIFTHNLNIYRKNLSSNLQQRKPNIVTAKYSFSSLSESLNDGQFISFFQNQIEDLTQVLIFYLIY